MSDNQLAIQQAPMFGLSTLEEAVNFAGQMAKANLLPAHLKGSPADCLRVVMQAARWQMDPFSVADKTSVISGKLMYEGQLVSAVVNARGNLSKRLDYQFEGEGDKRVLTVTGTLKGETEPRTITLDVPMARRINKNGQMSQNPDQQMCYIGARMWARRHTSELMLGVYTPDEVDPEDSNQQPENITPAAERPAPKPRATRGAAGAKEVVVTQEEQKATPQPTQDIQQAMQAREAKTQSQGGEVKNEPTKQPVGVIAPTAPAGVVTPQVPSEPVPAAVSRAFLKEGESADFVVKVETLTPTFITTGGARHAGFKATLSGGFVGEVRSIVGANPGKDSEGKETVIVDPAFAVGKSLSVTLAGKMSTAPQSSPLHGKVLAWISAYKPVGQMQSEEA